MLCVCGSRLAYLSCCSPFHQGIAFAPSPVQLMRSRFSAYCLHLYDYILHTYHPAQQQMNTLDEIKAFANSVHFTGLTVLNGSGETVLPPPLLPNNSSEQLQLVQQAELAIAQLHDEPSQHDSVQLEVAKETNGDLQATAKNPLVQNSANPLQTYNFAWAGFVEFEVQYIQGNKLEVFREKSRFLPVQTASLHHQLNSPTSATGLNKNLDSAIQTPWQWRYYDGELQVKPSQTIGRNDLCPCGSQKKFKQCREHRLAGQ